MAKDSEIVRVTTWSRNSGSYLIRDAAPGCDAGAKAGLRARWSLLILSCLALVGFFLFLMAPGTIGFKAHIALHGICAQRPSHSFWLGGDALPLDARMTGIYLAALTTLVWLALIRRLRAAMVPSGAVLTALLFFVATMGVDGTNGLMSDLWGSGTFTTPPI